MSVKHTPGPWKVKGSYQGSVTILALREHTDAHGKTSAFFGEVAKTHPVGDEGARKANARLIASAPDLLVAAVEIQAARHAQWIDPTMANADRVSAANAALDAAIAKATASEAGQ